MNLILANCEEIRISKTQPPKDGGVSEEPKEEKRELGFILVRGQNIMTINVEGPNPNLPIIKGHRSGRGRDHGQGSSRSTAGRRIPFSRESNILFYNYIF